MDRGNSVVPESRPATAPGGDGPVWPGEPGRRPIASVALPEGFDGGRYNLLALIRRNRNPGIRRQSAVIPGDIVQRGIRTNADTTLTGTATRFGHAEQNGNQDLLRKDRSPKRKPVGKPVKLKPEDIALVKSVDTRLPKFD